MRKKLALLLMTAAIVVSAVTPALACTPPLSPPKMPDLEKAYEACREAGKKAAENVVIPDSYFESETETEPEAETETVIETETESEVETETESETVTEAEPETPQKYMDWKKYIPESLRARWLNIVRR